MEIRLPVHLAGKLTSRASDMIPNARQVFDLVPAAQTGLAARAVTA
jgi:hypothetical protein